MSESLCQCREFGNHPHRGRTRLVRFDLNAQPSGHGSFTVPTEVRLCEAHAYWFVNSHVNAWVKE